MNLLDRILNFFYKKPDYFADFGVNDHDIMDDLNHPTKLIEDDTPILYKDKIIGSEEAGAIFKVVSFDEDQSSAWKESALILKPILFTDKYLEDWLTNSMKISNGLLVFERQEMDYGRIEYLLEDEYNHSSVFVLYWDEEIGWIFEIES